MKFKFISIAISIVLAMGSLRLHAETYYISSSGNDNNTGLSKTNAWTSIEKVNATPFTSGDTILFEGETIFQGSIYFELEVKGSPDKPIVLGSFGTGRAVIRSGTKAGFFAYNTSGFKIQDLVFEGSGRTTNTSAGIEFFTDLPKRLRFIAINNVEVYGYYKGGIRIGSWNGTYGYDDVYITNSSVHDNADNGISTYAEDGLIGHRNIYIASCKAYNNAGIPTKPKNTGSGIVVGGADGGIIEYCEAYNNGWLNSGPEGGPVGIWCYLSNNIVIQHNESHHNKTGSTKDGGGFDIDGGSTNCVMQYNYSHDNDGPGYLLVQYENAPTMKSLTVRYNISENDGRKNGYGGIHLWSSGSNGGIQDAQIYNNTVYVSPVTNGAPKAVWVQSGGTTIATFRNNLFVTTGGVKLIQVDSKVTANVRFEGNNYWSSGATPQFTWGTTTRNSLDAWRNATTQETRDGIALGYFLDPKLKAPGKGVNITDPRLLYTLEGYQLDTNSELIGKALNLQALFGLDAGKTDFWGNSINNRQNLCIGAHQVTDNSRVCLFGGPQLLTFGQAATTGTYSGAGVAADGYFTPEAAGTGNHALFYTFSDELGQQHITHHTVQVIDTKKTEWTGGGNTTDWFNSQNWSSCVPTPQIDAYIPAATAGATVFPNIKTGEHAFVRDLDAAGPLTIEQDATLEIHGTLTTDNLDAHPNSNVIFNSQEPQAIPAGEYGKLHLQGSGTKKLAGSIVVANQLDLKHSKLLLGDNNLLLKEEGGILNYDTDNYIVTDGVGKLTFKGMSAGVLKTFPVGTTTGYAPVALRNEGVTDNFSIRVEDKEEATEAAEEAESTINKTWHIEEEVQGGSDVTITLQWTSYDEPETFDRTQSYVSHYENEEWQVMETSTGTVTQGTAADTYQISLSGVNSFSPFTVASGQSMPTPMPVSLSSFTAAKHGIEVLLEWVTASEQNNHGFDVEVSEDGYLFRKLRFIRSKSPNSAQKQIYTYRDNEAGKYGTRYYRLRQIDLDGTPTYSFVRAVNFENAQLSLSVYPNPFSDMITLELVTEKEEDMIITLTDTKGKRILQKSLPLQKGVTKLPLNMSEFKEASFYILTAYIGSKTYHFKLLKK